MIIKECAICGKEFNTKGSAKTCGEKCRKEYRRRYNRQYHQNNKEHIQQRKKQYYQDNKEHIKKRNKQHYQDNKEHYQQYYQDNKEHILQKRKQRYHNNKEYYQQENRQYYQKNKEHILQRNKQHYQDNKEHYQQYYQDNKEHIQKRKKQHYQDNKEYYQHYRTQYMKKQINELIKQYDGDLEEILKNIPSKWHIREAQMQVWFNESYYDGIMAKMKSTPCCEITGETDNLEIHHLYSFNTHPKLGNKVTNMVRVAKWIHTLFHKEYGYGDNTLEQWEEFMDKHNFSYI